MSPESATCGGRLRALIWTLQQLQEQFEDAGLTPPAVMLGHPADADKIKLWLDQAQLLRFPNPGAAPGEMRLAGTRLISPLRAVP